MSLGRERNEIESPAQQFRRLKAEMDDLSARVSEMVYLVFLVLLVEHRPPQSPNDDAVPQLDIPAGLISEIKKMQQQLDKVALSKVCHALIFFHLWIP